MHPYRARFHVFIMVSAVVLIVSSARAEERQSLDDAWWTGPIVAAGAGTLPEGHALVEPYVFDVHSSGYFDSAGTYRNAADQHSYGSLTYMLYGITDSFTAGVIPTFGYNVIEGGERSNGVGLGDLSVQAQFRLAQFHEGSPWPTMSIVVQEALPTGKHDQLDSAADGNGSGAYATTLGLYSQYYFWLSTGRILRARFNLSHTWAQSTSVKNTSVYGTADGFAGHAQLGNSFMATLSGEYSMTRSWVIALDLIYQHDGRAHVYGTQSNATDPLANIDIHTPTSWKFGVAPAIEYNWSSNVGLIIGARWFAAGHNATASVTPVAALNMVF